MSDTPERISISPVHNRKRDDDYYLVDRKAFPDKGTEFVRADLHAALTAERDALRKLGLELIAAEDAFDGGGVTGEMIKRVYLARRAFLAALKE